MQEQKIELIDKLIVVIAPIAAVAMTWVLLLKVSPAKNTNDIIARLLASFFSSFILGGAAFVCIVGNHAEWLEHAGEATQSIGFSVTLGKAWLLCMVFAVCGLPGWWIVTGVVRWLEKNGDKFINDALNKAKDKVNANIRNKR